MQQSSIYQLSNSLKESYILNLAFLCIDDGDAITLDGTCSNCGNCDQGSCVCLEGYFGINCKSKHIDFVIL